MPDIVKLFLIYYLGSANESPWATGKREQQVSKIKVSRTEDNQGERSNDCMPSIHIPVFRCPATLPPGLSLALVEANSYANRAC
jgi:hypothetical protein